MKGLGRGVRTRIVMILDKNLKKLLQKSGIKASDLSRAVGVSAKTIHNWLIGQKPRDIQQVKKVAEYFGVSLDYLCFGKTDPTTLDSFQEEINAGVFEVVLRRVKK